MNRSNPADRVVRVIKVYKSGKVSHRDVTHVRPSTDWARAVARKDSKMETRVKDPKKVAAGKARAAQAKAQREAAAKAAKRKPKATPFTGLVVKPKLAKVGKVLPRPANEGKLVVYALRVRPDQIEKLHSFGRASGELLRDMIDKL